MSTGTIKKLCFWRVKRGRGVGLATLPPSMIRLPGQCRILKLLHPYRPPRPFRGIALLYFMSFILSFTLFLLPVFAFTLFSCERRGDINKWCKQHSSWDDSLQHVLNARKKNHMKCLRSKDHLGTILGPLCCRSNTLTILFIWFWRVPVPMSIKLNRPAKFCYSFSILGAVFHK
jgi:hypothetical protein